MSGLRLQARQRWEKLELPDLWRIPLTPFLSALCPLDAHNPVRAVRHRHVHRQRTPQDEGQLGISANHVKVRGAVWRLAVSCLHAAVRPGGEMERSRRPWRRVRGERDEVTVELRWPLPLCQQGGKSRPRKMPSL
ncbi:hypothetical protein SKAU_G00157940 [Synaphobranchus kaupii]|uniref:Uncharacterized protein n=1 Tax=Synaphobranchus kaupii TaxID=118154 RepID=A0A9Q1FHY0_SYNKA|nr:hypothetical protein SKAU_G00157940 [Synaphobranchus kaupii]